MKVTRGSRCRRRRCGDGKRRLVMWFEGGQEHSPTAKTLSMPGRTVRWTSGKVLVLHDVLDSG